MPYAVTEKPGTWRRMSSDRWPPKGVEAEYLWFTCGQSRTVDSVNYGVLAGNPPEELTAFDEYEIDASTTTGSTTRWDNAVGATPRLSYADLGSNDPKCLTYTSAPLEQAPFDNLGMPLSEGVPAALLIDLQPLANEFDAGHHLQAVIVCVDADSLDVVTQAGLVSVFRNAASASGIRLPALRQ